MYCSTARKACQGLFSAIYREVLSQSQKLRGVYWTIIILCYPYKAKKEDRLMFILIGAVFIWAIKLIYRLMEILLRIVLFPIEIILWAFRFLLF